MTITADFLANAPAGFTPAQWQDHLRSLEVLNALPRPPAATEKRYETMKLFRGFDASVPPLAAPAGCQAVCGYLGAPPGSPVRPNTPHPWTLAEWRRFGHLRQAPIWTLDFGASPALQGIAAARAAGLLGWAAHALDRRVIWLDAETTVNLHFLQQAAGQLHSEGFLPGIYGSASTAVDYAPLGWPLWIALWNNVPNVPPLPDVDGHQYESNIEYQGTTIDLSMFDGSIWRHFGADPRTVTP